MNRNNLQNHQFEISGRLLWVKYDNGEKLLCLIENPGSIPGAKEIIKDKAKFLMAVDHGQLEFKKVGEYGFQFGEYEIK